MTALVQANQSGDATGKLPPSSCRQDSATHVTCTAPAQGISAVVFQTYPSSKALYTAYKSTVAAVNSGQFRQNFNDCGSQASYGEVGWNHLFQHTKKYTVDQMTTGIVKDDQAVGRVFCNYTQGLQYIVWTQNDGHLMAYVAGPVHTDVWDWWLAVHHNIGIGGQQATLLTGGAAMATLGSYLARSASVRSTIQSAINGVQQCMVSPSSGEATLQHAIDTRRGILNALPSLSVSGLPNGSQLVSTLTTAMQDSIAADKDYQAWMRDFASSGSPCGSDPGQDSHYAAALNVSGAETTAKNAFVAIWNPMAPPYGQQAYSNTEF